MPIKLAKTTKSGIIKTIAIKRGATKKLTGFAAITRKASICSVTFIVPNSAAMAAPIRPATTTPTKTGTNSRAIAIATIPPTEAEAPKRTNSLAVCTENTMPVQRIVIKTIGRESAPKSAICLMTSLVDASFKRRSVAKNNSVIRPLTRQKAIILFPNASQSFFTIITPLYFYRFYYTPKI